jgi:hypothetical protein
VAIHLYPANRRSTNLRREPPSRCRLAIDIRQASHTHSNASRALYILQTDGYAIAKWQRWRMNVLMVA